VRGGPKSREDSDIGPLIDWAALQRVSKLVEDAQDRGAAVLTGGDTDGLSYLPTLLENVPDTADLAHEEAFGPVTSLGCTAAQPGDHQRPSELAAGSSEPTSADHGSAPPSAPA
jgi:hypothetical protein